ncbi:RNA polymerase sigma-70 factor [Proteiniphilum saccharofermentans]|jgi:RNA polymerase sigma-70 factor (family 1)|uniref:RNA polymerase sigma-70 factor n=1 Tax=Proteiniphilum saccharofermentans TaxID=1642647 RepID=A0A1R3SRB8_9BACT|nr:MULTISPECIES: RNA polymerase sigma-70 factor [Proteiniphilum]MDY9919063.1 RNA polymerase sigma-70 factor [Proteiniphilum sp.]SCD18956.1 RNA polymerase sigma-70 factor [Proteiniphilum saccharofermentans]SEA30688.1 RNA polymerase sigma-70 factor, ECF subfamily [Porphyromonadaceae bacterium KH3R12]SFS69552.1 RNA polymerase sigma-70 factor, ECF subfamily [Porphyromonadaceae bacterium NLAE-zl-C104]
MQKEFRGKERNEDHALFILLKKRDKEAFSMIYQKYHRYLYSLALKYLKSVQMAEDAVQHVFVKLWESTADIHIEINLKNYLYTMTKNYILNMIRDHKEAVSLNYVNAQIDFPAHEDILREVEEKQMYEMLYKCIEQLPPQKKEICMRKLKTSDSNQEIADKMGISVHTVKSHYQESLKILRSYFQQIKMLLL